MARIPAVIRKKFAAAVGAASFGINVAAAELVMLLQTGDVGKRTIAQLVGKAEAAEIMAAARDIEFAAIQLHIRIKHSLKIK